MGGDLEVKGIFLFKIENYFFNNLLENAPFPPLGFDVSVRLSSRRSLSRTWVRGLSFYINNCIELSPASATKVAAPA